MVVLLQYWRISNLTTFTLTFKAILMLVLYLTRLWRQESWRISPQDINWFCNPRSTNFDTIASNSDHLEDNRFVDSDQSSFRLSYLISLLVHFHSCFDHGETSRTTGVRLTPTNWILTDCINVLWWDSKLDKKIEYSNMIFIWRKFLPSMYLGMYLQLRTNVLYHRGKYEKWA